VRGYIRIMSLFITFEGGEGCGKTSQAKALYKRLQRAAIPVLLTQEPGGTPLGKKLSHFLKWTDSLDISPLTELFLFNSSRAQLVETVIRPSLDSGILVVCDRYSDSTTVYQGYGRGLDLAMVEFINRTATGGLKPDLTILLDIPVEEGLARKGKQALDRFEQEDIIFHQRVREGFLKLAADEPERWLVVDTRQPKAKATKIIWQKVNELLPRQEGKA